MNTHVPVDVFYMTLNQSIRSSPLSRQDPVFLRLIETLVDKKCEEQEQLRMDKLYLLVDLAQLLPKTKVSPTKPSLKSSLSERPDPITVDLLTRKAKEMGVM